MALVEHLLSPDAARYATAFNFGPAQHDAQLVSWIADRVTAFWRDGARWVRDEPAGAGLHEAGYLTLDSSRARAELNWQPRLNLETALHWLVDWCRAWQSGEDMHAFTLAQIAAYAALL
jgi:CDP-glucose 4,6-dehydratase